MRIITDIESRKPTSILLHVDSLIRLNYPFVVINQMTYRNIHYEIYDPFREGYSQGLAYGDSTNNAVGASNAKSFFNANGNSTASGTGTTLLPPLPPLP